MLIPTSGGTQMIVNGTIANGGVQPFVMQQVMQIQDPTTGAIQTGSQKLLRNLPLRNSF